MYWRNFVAASFLLFGALLTIITLISGCNKTVIRDAALATVWFSCELNIIANKHIVHIRLNFHLRL